MWHKFSLSHYMSKFPSNQFHVISGECMRVNCVSWCLPNDECALYVWDCRLDSYVLHEYAFHLNYVPFHACVFSCAKFVRTRFGTLTQRTFRLVLTASNSCLKIKRKSHTAYFFQSPSNHDSSVIVPQVNYWGHLRHSTAKRRRKYKLSINHTGVKATPRLTKLAFKWKWKQTVK